MRALPHSDYYQDRRNEAALIADFPGDELLINGLHAMQAYFATRQANIEIPVTRVMNTAHFTANYMFSIPCSDQREYDAVVYNSLGRDGQLTVIALIVLTAMLRRNEAPRARLCRSVIMEDRNEDFYDGVTLYEKFLESGEVTFPVEAFETDVMDELITLRATNEQLTNQNQQLRTTLRRMANQQNNNCAVFNNCTFTNPVTFNPSPVTPSPFPSGVKSSARSDVQWTSEEQSREEAPSPNVFCRITDLAHQEGKALIVENELRSACVSAPKLVRALRTNEALGYLDTQNLSSRDLYDLLNEHYGLAFKQRNFDHYRSK